MGNTRHSKRLERNQLIRDMRAEGYSREKISDALGVSEYMMDQALRFFEEPVEERTCSWRDWPHKAEDHRECRSVFDDMDYDEPEEFPK